MSRDPRPALDSGVFWFWTGRYCRMCGLKIYAESTSPSSIKEHCGCK